MIRDIGRGNEQAFDRNFWRVVEGVAFTMVVFLAGLLGVVTLA
ncbi:hypothetical protein [Aestuariispira insulae]|uniref:Uncharacterized protein n=1 Tax=Aestuariispira insulae TaxID=1461337 RepID=A0A3D9HRI5_9PROT|nr:hypothetical protein [Aestuariispira insulae]RED52123.1 hypothetical protein DFP90_102141 [Aestuariispira insulae]